MTANTGLRRVIAAGAMMAAAAAFAPAMADVRAGANAWAHGDYPRAIAEWRGPALAGDADAQFNMGQAYKLGRGVPADLPQAEVWYQKAAVQGHAQAQDNYGLALFQDGRKADALPWLEKSIARDEKRTELVLGTMLFNGDGIAKDWVRAYALVSRSSQQGLTQASQTLAQMDGYLSPEERQQGVAMSSQIADQARSAQLAASAAPPATRARPGRAAFPAGADVMAPPSSSPKAMPTVASTNLPQSSLPGRHHPAQGAVAMHGASGVPTEREVQASPPPHHAPPPAPTPHPTIAASGGHWHVQLGAFHDEGNARALWAKVGARVGGQPVYAHAGAVVRLQAGPFASKADAARACHAAATSCVIVP